jgi:zinc protease
MTIGYIEDLNRSDVNDLKNFFLRWYGPNNATLTIGGDVDTKQVIQWVEKYYGSIPRGPEVKPVRLPAVQLDKNRYASYTDNYARMPQCVLFIPLFRAMIKMKQRWIAWRKYWGKAKILSCIKHD